METIIQNMMPWVVSFAAAVVSASIPVALAWLNTHLGIAKTTMLNQLISGAVGRGAAMTASHHAPLSPDAVGKGVDYVYDSFPDALRDSHVTAAHVATMVRAEVDKIMLARKVGGPVGWDQA